MRARLAAVGVWFATGLAQGQEAAGTGPGVASDAQAAAWSFTASGYWNMPRQEGSYASGIFGADYAKLHLEARVNYEALHARSAFVGWSFSGGESIRFKATPIVGFVAGSTHGPIAGLEASVAAGKFDYYIEAEYLTGSGNSPAYTYAWSELAYRPVEWLRLGLAMQRTRIYGGDREFQRGGLVQLTFGKFTGGVYWFNPASSQQVVLASLAVSF